MSRMGPKPRTAAERAWKYIVKGPSCWEWVGALDSKGYGRIARTRTEIESGLPESARAHRIVYESLIGPIPEDLDLDHLCRNRKCVRPSHLEPVTRQVNLLRGNGVTAQNATKTHCPKGHEYAEENTYIRERPKGRYQRECRACIRNRRRLYVRRQRERQGDQQ